MLKQILGLVAVAGFTVAVHAVPITGSIDMSGTATLDNTALGAANGATAFTAVTVGGSPTGSFVGTFGDSVSWNAFNWDPPSTPVTPLWTFTDAGTGWTYTFDLTTVVIDAQDNFFLNLLGTGTLSITGPGSPYTPTGGTWSFTISNPSGGPHANFMFTFANSQTAVPDGGLTLALLGCAMTVLGLVGRSRK